MRLSIKRTAQTLVIAGAAATAMFAIPTAANASVSGCTKWIDGQVGYVSCTTTGSSQYRAHVKCAKIDDPSMFYWNNGKWVPPGPNSSAGCTGETYVAQIVVQTR